MIRFLLRFIGFWCLAGGFVVAVVDGTRSIAAAQMVFTPVLSAWTSVSPASLDKARAGLSTAFPAVWTHVAAPILDWPLFVVLSVLGLILMTLGRPPRRARRGGL